MAKLSATKTIGKAMDDKRGAKKHDKDTSQSGGNKMRSAEILSEPRGWTEEYCRYLDYLTTIDISYTAPWHQRHRYESTITLACNDEDRQAGPMKARRDFRPTTKILASLRQEEGRQIFFIPKNERMRHSEHQDSQWREHQDTQWRDHQWQDHQW